MVVGAGAWQTGQIIEVIFNSTLDGFEWTNQSHKMINEVIGASVASAAALPIIRDGNSNTVTGTTTITSINSVGVGTIRRFVFSGILTLTNHATNLILNNGGQNIVTAVGDVAEFIEYAAGVWRLLNYKRFDGPALPRNWIDPDGLIMSNHTDTDHDISISIGECRDSTDTVNIKNLSAVIKAIDVVWAAGSGAGIGGASSAITVGNNTWYYLYAIKKDSDGSIDFYFDDDAIATNIATIDGGAYTKFRLIGAVLTDGSANILQFVQTGDKFEWLVAIENHLGSQAATAVPYTVSVPPLSGVEAILNLLIDDTGNSSAVLISSLNLTDVAPSISALPGATLKTDRDGTTGNENVLGGYRVEAVSGQVRGRGTGSITTLGIWTTGYTLNRGMN